MLKQRVGCYRRADPHFNGRQGAIGYAGNYADCRDSGIAILFGVFRQKLDGFDCAIGRTANHIGKCPAAINPELPVT